MNNKQKCRFTDDPQYILKNIRNTLGVDSTVVYEGLCSKLSYEKYENGKNELNLFKFFFFLERMGVSNERFEVMIPNHIYEFYNWYENCMVFTEKRDWEGLRDERSKFDKIEIEDDKIQISYRDYVDYIIARYAYMDNDKAKTFIHKALSRTVKDIKDIIKEKKRLSIFEWNIFINLYDLEYEMEPNRNTEITDMMIGIYNYYKENTNEELIVYRVLPKLGLTILLNDRTRLSVAKRIKIEKEILPMASYLTALMNFLLTMIIFIIMFFVQKKIIMTSFFDFFNFLIFLILYSILIISINIILATVNVLFRDLQNIWDIILTYGVFLTPIIYTITIPKEYLKLYYFLNPLAYPIEEMKASFFGINGSWRTTEHLLSFILSVILWILIAIIVRKKLGLKVADYL